MKNGQYLEQNKMQDKLLEVINIMYLNIGLMSL